MSAARTEKAGAERVRVPGTTAVRVLERTPLRLRGGPHLKTYEKGEIIPPGPGADEALASKNPRFVPLGEEPPAVCPACGGAMTAEAIRAGTLVCERAHVVLTRFAGCWTSRTSICARAISSN